jgi:hypothetical protein
MSPTRRRVLLIGLLLVVGIVIVAALMRREPPQPQAKRPELLLLTSLPIVFGEEFSVRQNGSPALKALETGYKVVPISTTAPQELAKGRLLLMAQPLGQAPLDLVALDHWVRKGGRVMLLADPLLEWPSARPLGDPLRPPPSFVDTGLLGHWGLRLDAPDKRGPRRLTLAGRPVETVSPGALFGTCPIPADRLVARCRIGKGKATVVADADLLDVDDLGPGAAQNLDAVLTELAALARN